MNRNRTTRAVAGVMGAVLAITIVACSDPGDLSIVNEGPDEVTVLTGDHEVTVDSDGGAEILDYGCTPGDVTVVFSSGPDVVLPGPVCPEQRIVVDDGTALLQPAAADADH